MGVLPPELAAGLRDRLGLTRAIETGTYRGGGTRRLAAVFPRVVTVEVSEELARSASETLGPLPGVEVRQGSSQDVLPALVDRAQPTLYWLDGHWSGGVTGGEEDECPVLAELVAIASGHADDCILIDDARLFLAPPPPPHDPAKWPDIAALVDALARAKPGHRVLIAHDLVIAVPPRAADLAASFAHGSPPKGEPFLTRLLARVRS